MARTHRAEDGPLGGAVISQQIAARMLEELRSGCYAGADRLPAEVELAANLGVSRTVVRDALSDLERDGYLERVRGIGTLVNRDVVRVENRMDQKLEFNRMIRSIGRVPHSDNLMVTRETAMPELAAKLGLDPERGHIINGHTPVKATKGESPVKAGGRLFIIDGGFCKAAGYDRFQPPDL